MKNQSVDMFLQLDGISGETMDAKMKDAIDILDWEWGMGQPTSSHMGSGSGSGRVEVGSIVLYKFIDRASPVLIKCCTTLKHIQKAKITVRKAGGEALPYLTIDLQSVVVKRVDFLGCEYDTRERLAERVTLAFKRFRFAYAVQTAQGSKGTQVEAEWDIPAGV